MDNSMNQYLEIFIEEAREHLQAINEHLLELERQPDDLAIIQELFRSAHTLKGMSATMGFEDMASLTHELENVLDLVRNSRLSVTSEIMDVIFTCVDLLEKMVLSISEGGSGEAEGVAQIVEALKAIQGGRSGSGGAQGQAAGETSGKTAAAVAEESPQTEAVSLDSFDPFVRTVIQQSLESGHRAFVIRVQLHEGCVLKAARAYMVFHTLEPMGEIVKSDPPAEEIENEKFADSFAIVFLTREEKENVQQAIENLSEIERVHIMEIRVERHSEPEQAAAETAAAAAAPGKATSASANGPAPSAAASTTARVAGGKTIRVNIQKLDELMNLFSELVIDRGRLQQLARESGRKELQETVEHMSRIAGDIQNIILTMRMVPVEQIFNRFPRMVRDLAKELNKKVNLVITGAETELDRTVIDEIGDPLVHLLRNAIDHGLETAEERARAGKPEEGTIHLRAYHSGNHVFIEVEDDGKGIDRKKVLSKAVAKGMLDEKTAESLSEQQVYDLLFSSGFSTAEKVSDISGRGVGLDAVKTKIESLGGMVSIESQIGKGTKFLVQLPLTLSIISALLVEVGAEKYAIPLSSIVETSVVRKEDVLSVHGQKVIDFRGKIIPLVFIRQVFEVPGNGSDETGEMDEYAVVVVRKGDKMAGVVVDSFIGQEEIVLKSLGKYLANLFAISGATILGDGQVALIMDCNALIR
ncbi:chemotaxis protein CheA [Bacillaceae bacterium]